MAGKIGPVLWTLYTVWVTISAINVQTPQDAIRAARGKSATLLCTYQTSAFDRDGVIQWNKLLKSHTENVFTWKFEDKTAIYGDFYKNRVNISHSAQYSDASITIGELTMDDNGTYECSVTMMVDLTGTSRSRVHLLVLVPPSKPVCAIEGETVIGNNIQLTCRSEEGSPAPQYSWKSYDIQHKERPLAPAVLGQTFPLKNISTDMSGYYICSSSNEVGDESCNITLAVQPPSMNVALYAGIAGGVVAVLILVGIIIYCCCCRSESNKDEEARPNRTIYREPTEQMEELSRGQDEDGGYRHTDQNSWGRESLDPDSR